MVNVMVLGVAVAAMGAGFFWITTVFGPDAHPPLLDSAAALAQIEEGKSEQSLGGYETWRGEATGVGGVAEVSADDPAHPGHEVGLERDAVVAVEVGFSGAPMRLEVRNPDRVPQDAVSGPSPLIWQGVLASGAWNFDVALADGELGAKQAWEAKAGWAYRSESMAYREVVSPVAVLKNTLCGMGSAGDFAESILNELVLHWGYC